MIDSEELLRVVDPKERVVAVPVKEPRNLWTNEPLLRVDEVTENCVVETAEEKSKQPDIAESAEELIVAVILIIVASR